MGRWCSPLELRDLNTGRYRVSVIHGNTCESLSNIEKERDSEYLTVNNNCIYRVAQSAGLAGHT